MLSIFVFIFIFFRHLHVFKGWEENASRDRERLKVLDKGRIMGFKKKKQTKKKAEGGRIQSSWEEFSPHSEWEVLTRCFLGLGLRAEGTFSDSSRVAGIDSQHENGGTELGRQWRICLGNKDCGCVIRVLVSHFIGT